MGWHVACGMRHAHTWTYTQPWQASGCRYNEEVARVLVALVQTADDLVDEYADFMGPPPRPVPGATRDAELAAGVPYMLRSRCVIGAAGRGARGLSGDPHDPNAPASPCALAQRLVNTHHTLGPTYTLQVCERATPEWQRPGVPV